MTLSSVVAFITGGGGGLGRATAKYLASKNAKVIAVDLVKSSLDQTSQLIGSKNVITSVADVCDSNDVTQALKLATDAFGTVNTIINCAGIAPPMKTLSKKGPHDLDQFIKVMNINTIGTFNVIRLSADILSKNPLNERQERGVIINTASIAAYDGQIGQVAYAASKGAVVSMTLPLAREFATYQIRVNTIAPGLFLTPLLESLPEKIQLDLAQTVPFPKRLGHPNEYAMLIESIILNPMLNGEVIRLDGALRMQPS